MWRGHQALARSSRDRAAPVQRSPERHRRDSTTQRDRHLQTIAKHDRRRWQETSGYHWRALVEADISRFKRVIGGGLRSRTESRHETKIALTVGILNQMLELGRQEYVRFA